MHMIVTEEGMRFMSGILLMGCTMNYLFKNDPKEEWKVFLAVALFFLSEIFIFYFLKS